MHRLSLGAGLGILVVGLLGCQPGQNTSTTTAPAPQDTLQYARQLIIRHTGPYTQVQLGQGITARSWLLVPRGQPLPTTQLPVLRVPIQRLAALSTTQLAFIQALNGLNTLVAVDQTKRIYSIAIRDQLLQQQVAQVGSDEGGLNAELLLSTRAEVVLLAGAENKQTAQLTSQGVQLLPELAWLEAHPLGRAEWIKLYGALLNKQPTADSLFEQIRNSYEKLAAHARLASPKPSVFTGRSYRGTWYVPAGGSFAARLIQDAGAQYLWLHEVGTGSLPLSLEAVLAKAANAHFWLNQDEFSTLSALVVEDSRYSLFKAFQQLHLWNHNLRVTAAGGDDYWEMGPLRPDLVLADLVAIFHPQLRPGHQFVFYRKLGP